MLYPNSRLFFTLASRIIFIKQSGKPLSDISYLHLSLFSSLRLLGHLLKSPQLLLPCLLTTILFFYIRFGKTKQETKAFLVLLRKLFLSSCSFSSLIMVFLACHTFYRLNPPIFRVKLMHGTLFSRSILFPIVSVKLLPIILQLFYSS